MGNDLFGGLGGLGGNLGGALGGLMGGLAKSGLVPKDTPEGKLFAAQSELADLQKQEAELFTEIGRQAYGKNPSEWPQDVKLKLIQQNIAAAQATLGEAKTAQEQADAAKTAEDAKGRCPECGHKNPDGVKFCQECGSALEASGPKHCTACGAELSAGTRFCGECGARQEG
ncbi:MAG: zinc-ribbon domain-containing protein [Clostridiales Family XIII bacterium]|jgi:DNA-directed RNA polymerase subunit M/transcription elongation factor TFIIS|nr:zinc-ribbon domain-containing protein [Clostridiales Family XIII bacterium]